MYKLQALLLIFALANAETAAVATAINLEVRKYAHTHDATRDGVFSARPLTADAAEKVA